MAAVNMKINFVCIEGAILLRDLGLARVNQ